MSINQNKILGNFLPNVYIDNISLKQTEVQVDFHIKEAYLGNDKFSLSSYDLLKRYVLIKIEKVLIRSDFEEAKLTKSSNIGQEIKTCSLLDIISLDKKTNNNGIIERYYTLKFTVPQPLNNLSFILYSELDYDNITRDLSISIDRTKFNNQKKYEDVIIDTKIIQESEKFILPDGLEWYGDVTGTDSSNYFTTETPRRILQKIKYKNTKIQDYRNNFNNLRISDDLEFNNKTIFTRNLLDSFLERKEIVADYYDIVDDKQFVSFVFSVNFKNLITNSNYYFVNDNNINNIINNSYIKSCRLYRTQKIDKKANNSLYILSEKRELVSTSFEEYPLLKNLKDKKMFLIKDPTSNIIKSGIYEYSLELDIFNGAIEYLNNKVKILHQDQNKLVTYNNLINLPQYCDKQTNFLNASEVQIFYEQLGIEQIVINFINISSELGSFTTDQKATLINQYRNYTNPTTATPESILHVLNLHKQFLNNLLKYFGIKIDYNGMIYNSTPYKDTLININKKFDNLVDLNRDYEVKLRFIDIPDNKINYKNIENSVQRIIEQYDLKNDTNSTKEKIYSSLSPSNITINNITKNISAIKTSNYNSENYLDSVFTQMNLSINKKQNYKLQINENSNINNDIVNLLNFSKILEEHGAIIEDNIIKPQINNTLSTNQNNYYLNNSSSYNCSEGLTNVFNFEKNNFLEIKTLFDNQPNLSDTMPIITAKGFKQVNENFNSNLLFTSGKHIILYRIIYDLEFLDFVNGEVIWRKLTKNLFESYLQNKTCLFRLRQNTSPTTYDTSNMKTTNHFIVEFK